MAEYYLQAEKVEGGVRYASKIMKLDTDSTKTIVIFDTPYVKVVRCKDCKWFNDIGCAIHIVDDSDKPKGDDYCSFGERKDEVEE